MERYAIFFPQYDTNSVNNEAWGAFFNDWILVGYANAFNLWKQRRAPKKGFYNLCNTKDIEIIMKEAQEYRLDGFGLYHYYFKEGSILDCVEQYFLYENMDTNLKFFLIYANEFWTKRWIGSNEIILDYPDLTESFIENHVYYLSKLMKVENYKKISNKPLFIFYRLDIYKNFEEVLYLYRKAFLKYDIEPMLGMYLKHPAEIKFVKYLDCIYLFEPRMFFNLNKIGNQSFLFKINEFLIKNGFLKLSEKLSYLYGKVTVQGKNFSYRNYLDYLISYKRIKIFEDIKNINKDIKLQEVLCVGWNNSPRFGKKFTAVDLPTEEEFKSAIESLYLNSLIDNDLPILVNAWNEWSEGASIEPCYYLGDTYLKIFTEYKREEIIRI